MKFLEYLNAKGKLQEKPITAINADYEGPEEKAPEKNETDDLGYKAPKAAKSSPTPYSAGKSTNVNKKDMEKGLANVGDKDNVIEFPELGKMNNEEFITFTKGLPTDQFVKIMNEHCGCEKKSAPMVVAYSSGAYHPDPIQAIKYISYLTNENENLLRALIHETKRIGGLQKLCDRLMDYSDFYEVLKTKIEDKNLYENVKKSIMEHSKINEVENHGDEDQQDEIAKVVSPKEDEVSNMKLMRKKSKKN